MEMVYSVSAEPPSAVREELRRVWTENLTLATSAEERYRWLYEHAPEPVDRVFVLRAGGEDGAERIVGAKGLAVRRFRVKGRDALATVSGDFAVDVPHRSLMPALQLARAAGAWVKAHHEFGYGLPNAKADGVMLRAGFHKLGHAARWVRVLRHGSYAARLGERPGVPRLVARLAALSSVARVAGAAVDLTRLGLDLPAVARAARGHRLQWSDRPDARFDALWQAARDAYEVVGARTAAFLAWRYPAANFAELVRRSDGALRAYAVVEREPRSGAAHVRDLFGHPDALAPLVDLAIPALWRGGATSVSVRFLGAPRVRRLLEARGFEARGTPRTVVFLAGDRAQEPTLLADPDRWHLFDADEDS